MRFIVKIRIEGSDRAEMPPVPVGVIDRCAHSDPAAGLGLLLQEAKDLTQRRQTVVVTEHARQFFDAAWRCRACTAPFGIKDTKRIVYRTVFGVARLNSPRFYSCCGACGVLADSRQTFSPLAQALPERTHPQWRWLQCLYASVMSFRLAQIFLRDAFPAGESLPIASIKVNLRAVGTRFEREVQAGVARVVAQLPARSKSPPPTSTAVAFQIDAGYIRAAPRPDGPQWIAAVASKWVVPHTPHTPAHAYVAGHNPPQGLRQQAFLASIGIGLSVPLTVLSDGGEDITYACQLRSAAERVLDWFHIGMRFEHLLASLRGLSCADEDSRVDLVRRAQGVKWCSGMASRGGVYSAWRRCDVIPAGWGL